MNCEKTVHYENRLRSSRRRQGVLPKSFWGRARSPSAPPPLAKWAILAIFGLPYGALGESALPNLGFWRLGQHARQSAAVRLRATCFSHAALGDRVVPARLNLCGAARSQSRTAKEHTTPWKRRRNLHSSLPGWRRRRKCVFSMTYGAIGERFMVGGLYHVGRAYSIEASRCPAKVAIPRQLFM